MTAGHPKAPVVLAAEERLQLQSNRTSRSLPSALVLRARPVLMAAEGLRNAPIS